MVCEYVVGAKSYLALATESEWGRNPFEASGSGSGVNDWVHLPATSYGVKFAPENRQANPFIGTFSRKHSYNFRGMPSGTLVASLQGAFPPGLGKSLAEYLCDWAFLNHEECDLPSKSAYWAEGPNIADKVHEGLRVNSATIVGSDDSGILELSLDLMGKDEDNPLSSPAIPNDRNKLQEFEFHRCTFAIGGVALKLKSFTLQVQHGLQAHYLNSFVPHILVKTQRVVTLQMSLAKNANTYDAYRRATSTTEFTGQITARGLHNGTGANTYTTMQIDFPRLAFVTHEDAGGKEDVIFQNLNLVALKPDSSSTDLAFTWGTA